MTTASPIYSVVLPAHNEEALLEPTVNEIRKALRERDEPFEIVVVENGSTDATGRLAERLCEEHGEVRVIRLAKADYGGAIATGLLAATGSVIVQFDVDYYDVGFLDEAAALVRSDRAAIVLASKRAPGARDRRPLVRRVLTAGFATAMRLLLSMPVSDSHGMKVLAAAPCQEIARRCTMTGSLLDVELVLRASRAGLAIAELPADVSELRPPRTPVLSRVLESAAGLVRLRFLLWKESRTGSGRAPAA